MIAFTFTGGKKLNQVGRSVVNFVGCFKNELVGWLVLNVFYFKWTKTGDTNTTYFWLLPSQSTKKRTYFSVIYNNNDGPNIQSESDFMW